METIAASVQAVAAIEGGPLYRKGLPVGAQANEPPLLGMMPVYGPAGENRPGGAWVKVQNITIALEGFRAPSAFGVRSGQLRASPATQEPCDLDNVGGGRQREPIVPVTVARFLHVGPVSVGQSAGDHPAGCVHHSNGQTRSRLIEVHRPSARLTAVEAIDASSDLRPRGGSDQIEETSHVEQLIRPGYHKELSDAGLLEAVRRRGTPTVCPPQPD